MVEFTVEDRKERLDKVLATFLQGERSRSRIQQDIEAGRVLVNSQPATEPDMVVRVGDMVQYEIPVDEAPGPVSLPIKTLYDANDILVVDKPAGLSAHPGAGFTGDSLAQAIWFHYPGTEQVGEPGRGGIVHRLDKDTSGAMVIAKTPEMYEYLKGLFADRKVQKEYIALVSGLVEPENFEVTTPMGKSRHDFRKVTTDPEDMLEVKEARTDFRVLEHLPWRKGGAANQGIDGWSILQVKLHTGRMHQIRVHSSSRGFPVAGDKLYGPKLPQPDGLSRQFLHAWHLSFPLPNGEIVDIKCPLAEDLVKVLRLLHSRSIDYLTSTI